MNSSPSNLGRAKPKHVPSASVVLAICCAAIALGAIFLAISGGSNYLGGFDYRVYLTAGKMALDGTGAKFYDLPSQFEAQRVLWPQMTVQKQLLPFLAPPFVVVLFAPLALLPPLAGYCVWTIFNATLLWSIGRGILSEMRLAGRQNLVALAMIVTFPPVLFTVLQGQVSLLVVFSFFQAWKAAKEGRDFRAGLWLAVLLIRPQLLLAPLLVFGWKGRWKLLGGLGVGALILGAVSLALVGIDGLRNYAHLLGEVSNWRGIYGVQPQQMQTWRGFLHALFQSDNFAAVRIGWLLGVIGALGAVFWCFRGVWKPEAARFERQWGALGIAALFCCPYLYSHDLSLLLVCGALITSAARRENPVLSALPLVGYGVVTIWAISLAIWPRAWPIVALFEAGALFLLARGDFAPNLHGGEGNRT